jgi:hypothetical protein
MNRWLVNDEESFMIRTAIKASVAPIGLVHCTMNEFAGATPETPDAWSMDHARRVLWSLMWHSSVYDPLDSARSVLWELATFIDSITGEQTTIEVDDGQADHDRLACGHTPEEHATMFHFQTRHTFLECSIRGDLDGALRVVDAVAAEATDRNEAYNEALLMGAHVLATIAESLHDHGHEETH